jgi:hypothetical protein
MKRGSGTTTRQMQGAPQKAIYVWCNNNLSYPKNLTKNLGRDDLEIVSPQFIESDKWRGRLFSEVVLDHALELTERQEYEYRQMRGYIR